MARPVTVRSRVYKLFQQAECWTATSGSRCREIAHLLAPIVAGDAELLAFISEYSDFYKYDRRRTPLYDVERWPDLNRRTTVDRDSDACRQLTEFEDDLAMILTLYNKYFSLLQ